MAGHLINQNAVFGACCAFNADLLVQGLGFRVRHVAYAWSFVDANICS